MGISRDQTHNSYQYLFHTYTLTDSKIIDLRSWFHEYLVRYGTFTTPVNANIIFIQRTEQDFVLLENLTSLALVQATHQLMTTY